LTRTLRAALVASALAALFVQASARDVPPTPETYVLDEADWLDAGEEARLSNELLRYERETSNQLVVAIFRSLEGEDLADFSQRVAQGWRIGQAEHDNGILLAVFVEDRAIDIEVGYGLEPVVTDAIAAQIRTRILAPALREGRYADGIFAAIDALQAAARGEFEGTGRAESDRPKRFPLRTVLLPILAFLVLSAVLGRLGALQGPMVLGPPSWGQSGRAFRTMRGGFGGGFRGGGGGFRGGGGSFGGGGARGKW
jgi:uncharacterized protein